MRITINSIIKDTDSLIRKKSEEVALPLNSEDKALLEEMLTYVRDSTDEEKAEKYDLKAAVGIAAVQCGVLKKMLAIVLHGEKETIEYALVNPKIISHSKQYAYLKSGEGCLSVETFHEGYVPRAARITVEGYDMLRDEHVRIRARGYEAIVIQHEIDHFSGILYYDHINKENPFYEIPDAIVIE
ncbi:MAG: peptide deformylase [Erysipelotrichia bacterium]|nr:peptide deformylase [Erysipelotrichia bacterium]NCC54885.1 peptide deformylase [Erysipelotrichia bacterium]